ncbi:MULTISPECIES: carbohydrate kinase [unclassified Crossiella]|uniref:carbohydrate kinase family protein n=1 Tax=unclassified Crossiella TaxID=2620835 RepID=UPI001FFE8E41|nr:MULTISPECIES: carbohydrate kinase [unclassified Crossiella]MCK2238007.1 carbohydrate kinase [Crossiella sp. S99.2]MCK2255290.1 carbohydrate kinase [Crossiella sp. S99.1]
MIIVGGEALVDLVPDPSTMDGELGPLLPRLGGGPYNVAVALGRLDVPTGFVSRLSTDQFGDALLDRLITAGVHVGGVQRGAEPTTLAVVGLAADGSARYSFHTEGTADRLVTDPGPLDSRATALALGTLSLVLEPGASVYEQMMRREAQRGLFVSLDPNIRAGLIPDADAYRARFRGWLPHVTLLKLSVEDAAWLADGDPAAAVADWLTAGPAAVVLTSGGEGLTVRTAEGRTVRAAATAVDVVDTIGAGDTVHAATLGWLSQQGALSRQALLALTEQQWRQALEFAGRAAALTCSRAGAEPPYAAELQAR